MLDFSQAFTDYFPSSSVFSFSFIYFTLGYSIYIVYVTNRNKITNKRRKRKKLMVLVEVCGSQRSLAFELTTASIFTSCLLHWVPLGLFNG